MADQVEMIIADDEKVVNVWTPHGPIDSDVTLQVEDTKITVSKDYLSTCSPVFYNMFYGDYLERRTGEYVIRGTNAEDFTEFLRVVLPSRNPITIENVAPVLALADRFQMELLKQQCISFISATSNDVSHEVLPTVDLLRYAFLYNSEELMRCCENRLLSQEDIDNLRHAVEFKQLPIDARDFLFDLLFRLPLRTSVRSARPRVFFEILIGRVAIGRVVMELFSDVVPRTAENFRALCTGEKGMGKNGKLLHYKNCHIQRVYKGSRIVAGDILENGGNGESIYGESIEDESFRNRETRPGLLTVGRMTASLTTSDSVFCIFTAKRPADYGIRVAFGGVVEGMDVVMKIDEVPLTDDNKPKEKVLIAACGQL